ncbi:MAG: UvrD-helicase domain-containing protein [Planctomycetaceae bacterium]
MLDQLNPAQREAATTLNGPVLVLAGAGTGKTRVITFRMAELIRSGVSAEKILSVTFTNKAAKEMLERTKALLGGMRRRPWISTFHALCVDVLRQDITALEYPERFVILDRGDQESIARRALREIRVTEKQLKPADLLSLISRWKSAGIAPERAAAMAEDDKEFLGGTAYRKYQQQLKASGAVDFDDLLLLTDRLFAQFPEVLRKHQERFSHVQIDEYQDTNGLQFRIVEALVREHHNICVVGDDDQSIYGWRGAEVKHILGFRHQFEGAKTIRLEENYRCTEPILDVANRLVAHNRDRHKKELRANKPSKAEVRFLKFEDETHEAEKVVGEIAFYHKMKFVPLKDFAILFRTNEQPRLFESELRRQQIPYVLMGSQSFFDRKEIKDLIAYMKVLARPDDEQALRRIVNTPARGIGVSSVEKIVAAAVRDNSTFWEAVPALVQAGEITDRVAKAVEKFEQQIMNWRDKLESTPEEMASLMHEVIQEMDYASEIDRHYKDEQQQAMRKSMLEDFVNSLADYVEKARKPSLAGYLSEVALDMREMEPDKDALAAADAVKLMTLHSAKGLEFPRVYLVGMEEGILPHKRSVEATESEIAEERRLAYVGVTRAQDHLTLTRAETRRKWGKPRRCNPSRFLYEMREE